MGRKDKNCIKYLPTPKIMIKTHSLYVVQGSTSFSNKIKSHSWDQSISPIHTNNMYWIFSCEVIVLKWIAYYNILKIKPLYYGFFFFPSCLELIHRQSNPFMRDPFITCIGCSLTPIWPLIVAKFHRKTYVL